MGSTEIRSRGPSARGRTEASDLVVPLVDRVRKSPPSAGEFDRMPSFEVPVDVAHWAEAVATGAFSPLEGFQHADEVDSVLRERVLPEGHVWSVPLVFAPLDGLGRMKPGQDIVLTSDREPLALFEFEDAYPFDPESFAESLLGESGPSHPGAVYIRSTFGPRAYAGKITLLRPRPWGALQPWRLDPAEARRIFAERRWKTVVAFQTTNPPHRAYEYIHRTVLELFDGLFIHPVVDAVRSKYPPLSILKGYQALIENYYRADRVVLGAWRSKMLFAGPRDALHHAIVRRNFGCTHIVIGRRHADTEGLYGDYAAWSMFDEVDRGRLGIQPLFFREVQFCPRCGGHVTDAVCPHGEREPISGTRVRAALNAGQLPPQFLMRPEVADAVRDWGIC